MPSPRDILFGLVVALAVGLVGAIPFGLVALLFGGSDVGRDIYLLEAIILGSWIPLKFIVDAQIKGQSNFRIPQISLNQLSLLVIMLGLLVITPILYFATFTSFLIGAVLYSLTGGNLGLALIAALAVQVGYMARGSIREKERGVTNNVFVRMQDFSAGTINIQIDPDQVVRQTPREETPPVIYLPEDNLRDRSQDVSQSEPPMTINIDPESLEEKSNDDA